LRLIVSCCEPAPSRVLAVARRTHLCQLSAGGSLTFRVCQGWTFPPRRHDQPAPVAWNVVEEDAARAARVDCQRLVVSGRGWIACRPGLFDWCAGIGRFDGDLSGPEASGFTRIPPNAASNLGFSAASLETDVQSRSSDHVFEQLADDFHGRAVIRFRNTVNIAQLPFCCR